MKLRIAPDTQMTWKSTEVEIAGYYRATAVSRGAVELLSMFSDGADDADVVGRYPERMEAQRLIAELRECGALEPVLSRPKRSFLRLPVEISAEQINKVVSELDHLADTDWQPTYWATEHCSVAMVLLRGGTSGTDRDFSSSSVADQPVLRRLPTLEQLIGGDGPFGAARYAFIFRMEPNGVSRLHIDWAPIWRSHYRVHVPIATNDDAILVSEDKAKHLGVGEAWTFDNQAHHGFSNGSSVRTHLILDVCANEKMKSLLESATYDEGVAVSAQVLTRMGRSEEL